MKVAFFGTPAYALPTLDALVEAGHEVVTVVAQPDRRSGRGRKVGSPPTIVRARELGIRTRQPRGLRSGPFPQNYGALDLDVAVVVAYGRILPQAVLDTPCLGSINGHGSLLPRWRGAAPIQHALWSGDTETGVCAMQMDAGLDTGDVLLSRSLTIGPDEQQPELALRLAALTAEVLVQTLQTLETLTPVPQDHAAATHARPLTKEDARLDLGQEAQRVHDHVRALQPWPGAALSFRGEPFKIKRSRVISGRGTPGEILEAGSRLVIACHRDAIEVVEGQLPGRRPLSGRDLVNGARILVIETFE